MKDVPEAVFEFLKDKDKLEDWIVVFPNTRQGFFLDSLLAKYGLVFPPRIFPVNEFWRFLLSRLMNFSYADFDDVLVILKDCVGRYIQEFRSWDTFYPWSRNIFHTIEELERFCIEDSAIEDVHRWLVGHSEEDLFYRIWRYMKEIKEVFYNRLYEKRLFTPSLIRRLLLERADLLDIDAEGIVFAGQFLHPESDLRLIKVLKRRFNVVYMLFGIDVPRIQEKVKDLLEESIVDRHVIWDVDPDKVKVVPSLSGIDEIKGAVRFLPEEIRHPRQVGVILSRQDILLAFLDELGDRFGPLNVSLGFPVKVSSGYSFVELLFKLVENQRTGQVYYKDLINIFSHYYLLGLDPSFREAEYLIKTRSESEDLIYVELKNLPLKRESLDFIFELLDSVLTADSLGKLCESMTDLFWFILKENRLLKEDFLEQQVCYQIYLRLDKLRRSPLSSEDMGPKVAFRYIRQLLSEEDVAFEGTPLEGLQVMSPLQGRGLSMETLIYLDVNERFCPSDAGMDLLMPDQIREKLGVALLADRELLFMYDFYSEISLADRVYLFYVEYPDRRFARSRFISQLEFLARKKGKSLSYLDTLQETGSLPVMDVVDSQRKFEVDLVRLEKFSPTSIETYLACPVRFFYQYVLGLSTVEERGEEVDRRDIGTLIHAVLARLYRPMVGEKLSESFFMEAMGRSEDLVEEMVAEYWPKEKIISMRGRAVLEVIKERLRDFIEKELKRWREVGFSIFYVEDEKDSFLSYNFDINGKRIMLYGRMDRVDIMPNGEYVVWDYKTGGLPGIPNMERFRDYNPNMEAGLLLRENSAHVQLPAYVFLFSRNYSLPVDKVNAGLIGLKTLEYKTLFNNKIKDRGDLLDGFIEVLIRLFREMRDPGIPFSVNPQSCSNCGFRSVCNLRVD